MNLQPINISTCRKYFSVLLLLFIGLITYAQDSQLIVISNIKGAPGNIKMAELKSIFKGEKQRWSDKSSTKVYLAIMEKTATATNTCSKIYEMSENEVKKFWMKQQFSGKADAPKFWNTEDELVSYIADTPGAIGIISKSVTNPNIKIIMVDGKNSF